MRYDFDLLGKYQIFLSFSIALMVVGGLLIYLVGPNLGIDFTGGTQLSFKLSKKVSTSNIRSIITQVSPKLARSKIQDLGNQRKSITTKLDIEDDQEVVDNLSQALKNKLPIVEDGFSRKSVGTQVSQELQRKGWQAILLALLIILIYISWRFRLRYAVGAVSAVVHDVVLALTIFTIFQVEINLPTIGAFLTIVGYSLNDTIVYFDRIRENEGKRQFRNKPVTKLINTSINQSLPRTIGTSATTFMPVFAMFLFGGPVLKPFSLALLIGVISGTYSSVYVATPIVYLWDKYLARE